ncbi:2-hydroxyacid dehydrogenase [Tuberibacillus sp. Marseille-P3662]|uniref:2-hydroxyacid dehydrogenase n=1 Tax=Tuberibacillus sp. Marseille-P3662 TaxID=1965358 RepID=UPI000A1CD1FB|nr:D-glycerate dehydrogenase [Tuberibacillus sp. Marseille-P3662]
MGKPNVYVTRQLPEDIIGPLRETAHVRMWDKEYEPVPRDVLLEESRKADGLLTMLSDAIDEALLTQSPHLKVVVNLAVGYDNIDVDAAQKREIMTCHTPDVLTETTADLAFSLLMATARRIPEAVDYVRNDQWKNWGPFLMAGQDIHHRNLGIVGMGRIGEAVAKRARGFDMNVLYYNRSRKPEAEDRYQASYCSFYELLKQSDYVLCLTPLTPETKHLFNAEAFQLMKNEAFFINVSRGAVVDETALIHALRNQDIAGAGLDVFADEPINASHPLLAFNQVVALPHIGSASVDTRREMVALARDNLQAVLQGKAPLTPIAK